MALTTFSYELDDSGEHPALRWELSARELDEYWHPQPFFDHVTVVEGALTLGAEEGSAALGKTFDLGPGTPPVTLRSTGAIVLRGTRLPLARAAALNNRATSQRHARRLHRARFGVSAERLAAIIAVQEFIDAGCPGSPRDSLLVNSVNFVRFYDQAHFSRTFRSVTGLSPSKYLEHDAPWVEALMAISSKLARPPEAYREARKGLL